MPKVFIQTHGCQMNEYDSSRMLDLLQDTMQMSITEDAQQADLLLLNTCSIREKAQEKVFSLLGRWNKLKQNNPSTVIAVGGCVASQEGDALKQRAPMVDVVFGPQTLHRLPELIKTAQSGRKTVVDVSFPEIEKFDHLPTKKDASGSAFVSIMEGCSKYCTFCVVPYTRGDEISRPFDDVIAEVAELASLGVKEVNLLGQNVNAYRGQWEGGEYADLAILIQTVAQIDGIERIRFTTSHPVEFSDSLIDVYAEVPELVSHVHLPVQSGSDRILAAMKRGHTALEYKSKIRRLREVRPDISVSSDFIIGFPDETDADFEDTVNLIDQIGFDFSFSFIYSQRPGTPASYFEDNVPDEVKKQRLQIVQHKINDNAARISRMMVGGTQRILVDGKAKRQPEDKTIVELSGKTENNRSVTFSCPADQVDQLMGQFVEVHINDALINSLRGEWPGHSA